MFVSPAFAQANAADSAGSDFLYLIVFIGMVSFLFWGVRQKEKQREKQQTQIIAQSGESIIKTYKGNQSKAMRRFQADASAMASRGYFPTSQTWSPGQWSSGDFIVAVLLCFILIGFLALIYMLIVKPDGTLTVTYEKQAVYEEKTCPMCAERIKAAALICHFCGHKFAPADVEASTADVEEVYRGYTYLITKNGETKLRLSSSEWRNLPSVDYLKAYVDALTANTRRSR